MTIPFRVEMKDESELAKGHPFGCVNLACGDIKVANLAYLASKNKIAIEKSYLAYLVVLCLALNFEAKKVEIQNI